MSSDNIYIIIAYRRDANNLHHYVVGARANKSVAEGIAMCEREERGGKYGVAVYQCSDDRSKENLLVYYVPSYGSQAKRPRMDWNEWVHQQVGRRVMMTPDEELPASLVEFRNNTQRAAEEWQKMNQHP